MTSRKPVMVREVWQHNMRSEFDIIRTVLTRYSVVAMDTEFPGTLFKPKIPNHLISHINPWDGYQFMKMNVDALKLIQLGLTLSDVHGNLPDLDTDYFYVWQFNFNDFDMDRDHYDHQSIQFLERQGIDFQKNKAMGINSCEFGRLMMESELLFRRRMVTWVTFHGSYDFGYLLKILTQSALPPNLPMFMVVLTQFFGVNNFDMKYMMTYCNGLNGGLERVARTLGVERIAGESHQAGSDSLLTLEAFMKMKETYFGEEKIHCMYSLRNVLSGIEIVCPPPFLS